MTYLIVDRCDSGNRHYSKVRFHTSLEIQDLTKCPPCPHDSSGERICNTNLSLLFLLTLRRNDDYLRRANIPIDTKFIDDLLADNAPAE